MCPTVPVTVRRHDDPIGNRGETGDAQSRFHAPAAGACRFVDPPMHPPHRGARWIARSGLLFNGGPYWVGFAANAVATAFHRGGPGGRRGARRGGVDRPSQRFQRFRLVDRHDTTFPLRFLCSLRPLRCRGRYHSVCLELIHSQPPLTCFTFVSGCGILARPRRESACSGEAW